MAKAQEPAARRRADEGFVLLDALAALFAVAIGFLALTGAAVVGLRFAHGIEDRLSASVEAQTASLETAGGVLFGAEGGAFGVGDAP